MRDISAAAEHHYDRMLDRQHDEEALLEYLDENGITWEQYEAMCKQAQEDAAADAAEDASYWRDA